MFRKNKTQMVITGVLVSAVQIAFCANIVVDNSTKANLPAAGTLGRLLCVTDDAKGIWLDDGSNWVPINGQSIVVSAKTGASIQSAIDNITSGIVVVPPGTYTDTAITLKSNVALVGAGRGATILQSASDSGQVYLTVITIPSSASNVLVRDLTATGFINGANDSTYGIDVAGTNVLIDNVELKNHRRPVRFQTTAQYGVIRHSRILTSSGTSLIGIHIQGGSDIEVLGNTITNASNGILWSNSAARPRILYNRVISAQDYCIGGDPAGGATTGTDGVVSGNIATGATSTTIGHGFSIDGSLRFAVANNIARSNASSGFFIGDNPSTDSTFTGNVAENNTQCGFAITNAVGATFSGNIAKNNGWSGFRVEPTTTDATDRIAMTGNTAIGNGYGNDGSSWASGFGIMTAGSTISGNIASKNIKNGLYLCDAPGNTIIGNVCEDNDDNDTSTYFGIFIEGTSCNNVIANNVSRRRADTAKRQLQGIHILTNANDNLVIGNMITPNGTYNYSDGGARNRVIGNRGDMGNESNFVSLANNGTAPLLSHSGFVTIMDLTNRYLGTFVQRGASNATVKISDPSSKFSITAGTTSRINFYYSAGNSRYEVQNKTGGAIDLYVSVEGN
ncbi:MAG: right-handed parallel beta-helix repeat-containing protein [Phycisphaerae bacterium]